MIGRNGPRGQALRPAHRAAHLARLETLEQARKLVIAGPFGDGSGSFAADSIEDARVFAEADPYLIAGVFDAIDVRPFVKVLPVDPPARSRA
jgi:uncharacterized protein YciI